MCFELGLFLCESVLLVIFCLLFFFFQLPASNIFVYIRDENYGRLGDAGSLSFSIFSLPSPLLISFLFISL